MAKAEESNSEWLVNLLSRSVWPITAFIKGLETQCDEEIDQLLSFLVPIMDTVEANLTVLDDVLTQSLGPIEVELTEKFRLFGGFRPGDFGRAYARKPQADQTGFELDPIVRGNLIKDVEKLAGMSPELQLMAESICEDFGLPLPEAIKEKIAREKAARES